MTPDLTPADLERLVAKYADACAEILRWHAKSERFEAQLAASRGVVEAAQDLHDALSEHIGESHYEAGDVQSYLSVDVCERCAERLIDLTTALATYREAVPVRVYDRDPACVAEWPECESGHYDPRCCRFPKSCSCNIFPEAT